MLHTGFYEHRWYREASLTSVFGSELVGTFLLAYVITTLLAVCITDTLIPIAIGSLLLALCNICGDLSGAHFNPSITLAIFAVEPKFSVKRCGVYLFAEIIGAVCGLNLALWTCVVLKNPFSVEAHTKSSIYNIYQLLLCEAVFTYIMTMTCLRCAIVTKTPNSNTALWVAGAVIVACYAGGPISGACMNPALAIAFALKNGKWLDILVYTIGPLMGCAAAVLSCMLIDPTIWLHRTGIESFSKSKTLMMRGGDQRSDMLTLDTNMHGGAIIDLEDNKTVTASPQC